MGSNKCEFSRPKALTILSRSDERLDHLGTHEIPVELIQLRQPEIVAGVVIVLRIVRIAPQVTEELHQHEGAVEFICYEYRVFGYSAQRPSSGRRINRVCRCAEVGNRSVAVSRCWRHAGVGE